MKNSAPKDYKDVNQRLLKLASEQTGLPTDYAYEKVTSSGKGIESQQIFKKLFNGFEPKVDPEGAAKLAKTMWDADPLSDRALFAIEDSGKNPYQVIAALLDQGIDAFESPQQELIELWQHMTTVPGWVDWEKIEHGARIYRRYDVQCFEYQGIVSIDGYRMEGFARTLMSTGNYADDTAYKRYLLTCNFWTAISEPEGLKVGNAGWKTANRVRLLHTLIRRQVFSSPQWKPERYGMPINQMGMMIGGMLSSCMMGHHLKLLGYHPSREDTEAMMHLWRYVTHILGCQHEEQGLWPETLEEGAQTIFNALNSLEQSGHPDCISLGASFINSFKPAKEAEGLDKLKQWWHYKMVAGQSLFFVSPETRKLIDAPATMPWALIYWLLNAPKNYYQDFRRARSDNYSKKLDKKISIHRRQWVKETMQTIGAKPTYDGNH